LAFFLSFFFLCFFLCFFLSLVFSFSICRYLSFSFLYLFHFFVFLRWIFVVKCGFSLICFWRLTHPNPFIEN
jgi:hypothetical protein